MRNAARMLAGVLLCAAFPAHAFLGVGDVSFDPQSYGELVSIYGELQQSAATLDDQLHTLKVLRIQMQRAQQSDPRVRNPRLNALASALGGVSPSVPLSALKTRIDALRAADPAGAGVYAVELQQLAGLRQLARLRQAADSNVRQSTTDLGVRASARLTAQSTATLAALAVMAQQRARVSALQQARGQADERGVVAASGTIYRALGTVP